MASYESVTYFLMDNVTVVFLNGTSEMSNSVIISEVSDLMLVSIHDSPKETDCMSHLHLWILTLISKHLAVTVTTFTQCGPVEDHSWGNRAPVPYDVVNLKRNCTYEAITAIDVDVLGNSSSANTKQHNLF